MDSCVAPPGDRLDHVVDDALAHARPDTPLGALLTTTLESGWRTHDLPADRVAGLVTAIARAGGSDAAIAAAHTVVPELRDPTGRFAACYSRARTAKFAAFADLLIEVVRPGLVVDTGAGDTRLVTQLATRTTGRSEWIATDIAGEPVSRGMVRFVPQPDVDRLPVADGCATTILATGMLHHMTSPVRDGLLDSARRALARGGRLVVLEDTYPSADWRPLSAVDARFAALDDDARRRFLAWTDWWGNRLLKGRATEPLPCTFQTMAAWSRTFRRLGLRSVRTTYLGLDHLGGHMATPRALFVLEACP